MNDGSHGIAKFRPFKIKGVQSIRWPLIALAAVFLLVAGGLSPMVALAQTPPDHYDADGDGLIEIDSLAQLNAVRWDLDGNGAADRSSNDANYAAAFPVAEGGSVCPAGTDCAGYELTANLDFDENEDGEITEADATYWNNGGGWLPIGRQGVTPTTDGERVPLDARLFHVTFDGNGHTIANLYADRSTSNAQGLFSVLGTGAKVRNLGLPGVNVTGNRYAGGLASWSEMGTSITAAWATGKVVGHYDIGGLIGETFGSATRCWAAVDVTGQIHVGGLVGENEFSGTITDSYATGSVNGGDRDAGGLVGYNAAISGKETVGTIIRSYATGSVSGNANVGGLVGANDGTIKASYARGTVRGNLNFGGLTGYNTYGAIRGSYAVGTVSGRSHAGGLVGRNLGGPISASYYDSEVSGRLRDSGNKRTAELTAPTGYAGIYAGWNLDLDNADGDGDASTGGDDPWHFGTATQYPVLKADFNGDGTATWQEFGYQVRLAPRLSATLSDAQVSLNWPDVSEPEWSGTPELSYVLYRDGKAVTNFDGRSRAYTDASPPPTDAGVAYQVALLLDGVERMRSNVLSVYATALRKDSDGDGLMEISNLDQLNAVRWDLNANGRADRVGNNPGYTAAFPEAGSGSVCVAGGDGNDGVPCRGYELATDLDFNDAASYASGSANMASWAKGDGSGAGWHPIGGDFAGVFDGDGHTITNLYVNRPSNDYVGLFSIINRGTVRNLGLRGVEITGKEYVGGLVGSCARSTINSSYVTGTVSGNSEVGGLTGRSGAVTIRSSYVTGSISGDNRVGGLVGLIWSGPVSASYAMGTVSGNSEVGGLVGNNRSGTISSSYAAGTVSGNTNVGGLAGRNSGGTIRDSYYDRDTSGLAGGKTTADLTNPTGYTGIYATWDDDGSDVWDFGTDQQYPALKVDFNGDNTATWEEFGYQSRLTATASGTQIELSWNGMTPSPPIAASNISYVLYRNGEKVTGYDGSSTSYTDTGLTSGQTYTYQVATLLDGVETQRSNRATLETAESPDLVPLTAFYNATGGANWTYNKNWLSAEPLGRWAGVATDSDGRVIALDLPNNNLRGSLPEEISDLTELLQIYVHDNEGLSGSLPLSMTGMSSMKRLSARGTGLCAPDNAALREWLDGLTEARVRECPDDSDRAVLMEFYNATNGPNWTVNVNWGSDKPLDEWAGVTTNHLGRVKWLTLGGNNLNGTIPESFGNLTELRQLYLYGNDLKGPLPTSMGNLSELWIATLGGNEFTGPLPAGLGSLTNLEELRLQNNRLTGPLPASLGNLKKLELLYLHRQVDENGNGGLTGSIPASMGSMTSLQSLVLDRNNLSGSIPVELGNLSNLRRFAANRNQLTGAIPTQLGNLRQLQVLGLANNDLSGTLPSELGNLEQLERLSLHDNEQLTGSLPSGIGGLSKLYRLAISNTGLSGTLPSNMTNLGAMRQLFFDGTGLCAPTDNAFQNWLNGISEKRGDNCR